LTAGDLVKVIHGLPRLLIAFHSSQYTLVGLAGRWQYAGIPAARWALLVAAFTLHDHPCHIDVFHLSKKTMYSFCTKGKSDQVFWYRKQGSIYHPLFYGKVMALHLLCPVSEECPMIRS